MPAEAVASAEMSADVRALTGKVRLAGALARLSAALRVTIVAEMLLFLAARGLGYFSDVHSYAAFDRLLALQAAIEGPARNLIKACVPTTVQGNDISGWIVLILLYLAEGAVARQTAKLRRKVETLKQRKLAAEQAGAGLWSLQSSLAALARGENLDRKKVLEIYAEAKKTLEGQKRDLAFLSIDVVDSTGMKMGESPEVIERDMMLYRKVVEEAIASHGSLKAAWTPDGVMICFPGAEHAVKAGQRIVRELRRFNSEVKTIKRDFAVRIGVNSGLVSFDEAIPMEEMADRVIDITGHMQKYGTVNAVCVTGQSAGPLLERVELKKTARVVDGCEVYEWTDAAS